ncbi:MAG: hypothetical protein P0107_01020 [Nitrosomonas sp.]|nr:hypothetical protein [Nitrosomonas sp.]
MVKLTSLAMLNHQENGGVGEQISLLEKIQPLGIPLSSGGPYFGFMTCKQELVRQMPGRIIGRTTDLEGKEGFALTLQAREQHIRRSKATSNICTNQGLMVTAATIYMSLLGPEGLYRVAAHSHANTMALVEQLEKLPGVKKAFHSPFFHEAALQLSVPADKVLNRLKAQGVLGGVLLENYYPDLKNTLLVCATETKTAEDLDKYTEVLRQALAASA